MAHPKRFTIEEDMRTLRSELRRGATETVRAKLRVLILYKEHEQEGISKHSVARALGVDPGSALRWRNAYIQGGLPGLLSHKRKGNRPSVIKPEQREVLREKLHEPGNGLRGFTEMVAWFNGRFNADVKYNTMNKFVKRTYGAQSKVARKSHVKKDEAAVAALKKTSRNSARS
jgi:transposase